jgi:uncharacterized protein (DUF2336 family)
MKDIERIRESRDVKYLLRLLNTGDALEKGEACERLAMGIINTRQLSSAQIDDIRGRFISLFKDDDVFVRRQAASALRMICGLDI